MKFYHLQQHGWTYFILRKICQTKTNTVCYHLYMVPKKLNKLGTMTKKKLAYRYREQTSGYQSWEGSGEGQGRGRSSRGTNYYV